MRHEADPRRPDAVLHGQGDGGYAPLLYGVADQPDGPVAQGSRGREQHRVDAVVDQLFGDLGGRLLYQGGRVVYGAHEGEVAWSEPANEAVLGQRSQRLEGEDGVEVGAFVGTVVGVGPGEFFGVGGDLAVRAVAFEVVYIEA